MPHSAAFCRPAWRSALWHWGHPAALGQSGGAHAHMPALVCWRSLPVVPAMEPSSRCSEAPRSAAPSTERRACSAQPELAPTPNRASRQASSTAQSRRRAGPDAAQEAGETRRFRSHRLPAPPRFSGPRESFASSSIQQYNFPLQRRALAALSASTHKRSCHDGCQGKSYDIEITLCPPDHTLSATTVPIRITNGSADLQVCERIAAPSSSGDFANVPEIGPARERGHCCCRIRVRRPSAISRTSSPFSPSSTLFPGDQRRPGGRPRHAGR